MASVRCRLALHCGEQRQQPTLERWRLAPKVNACSPISYCVMAQRKVRPKRVNTFGIWRRLRHPQAQHQMRPKSMSITASVQAAASPADAAVRRAFDSHGFSILICFNACRQRSSGVCGRCSVLPTCRCVDAFHACICLPSASSHHLSTSSHSKPHGQGCTCWSGASLPWHVARGAAYCK